MLIEIARFEHDHNRPMLTALVVHKGKDNIPGDGFYEIAQTLGYFNDSQDEIERLKFWVNQVTNVHNRWAGA